MQKQMPRIAIIVSGLTLAGAGYYGMIKRMSAPPPAPNPRIAKSMAEVQEIRNQLAERDAEVLRSGRGTDQQKFEALVRGGQRQDLDARAKALAWKSDSSSLIREGAANALGEYDDELSLGALDTLIQDQVRSVRVQALRSLGKRPGKERFERIEKVLAGAAASDPEWKARAWEAYYKTAQDPATRSKALEGLLGLSTKFPTALDLASSLEPRSQLVVKALRARALEAADPVVAGNALRQLAVQGDAWTSENWEKFWKRNNSGVKSAALQSIPMICPRSWLKVVESALLSESDPAVRSAAIETLGAMPGSESASLARKALDSSRLDAQSKERLRGLLPQIESAHPGPCDQRVQSALPK